MQKKKYPKWFYIVLLSIPIVLIVVLEISLRVFDYGKNLEQWVEINDEQIILNPDIAYRYFFSTEGVPYPPRDPIDIDKKENSFRVFVVGGSSAAGFPYAPNGTIAKYIKKRLELSLPDKSMALVGAQNGEV